MTPKKRRRLAKLPPTKLEPSIALTNEGALYLCVTPSEARAARKLGRRAVTMIALTPKEQRIALLLMQAGSDQVAAELIFDVTTRPPPRGTPKKGRG